MGKGERQPRKRFVVYMLSGIFMEIAFFMLLPLVVGGGFAFLIPASIPILLTVPRIISLILTAITEKKPLRLGNVETNKDPEKLRAYRPGPVLKFLGFGRHLSLARAVLSTRGKDGFFPLWCIFAKVVHHIGFLFAYLLFFSIRIFYTTQYWVFLRLLLFEIGIFIYTVYYDLFLFNMLTRIRDHLEGGRIYE